VSDAADPGESGASDGPALADGRYEAFVVDATETTGAGGTPAMVLDLTITAGEHKGEVLTITATGIEGSDIELLGMPATLTVEGGRPHVRIED
jgi:hypothetical protein